MPGESVYGPGELGPGGVWGLESGGTAEAWTDGMDVRTDGRVFARSFVDLFVWMDIWTEIPPSVL